MASLRERVETIFRNSRVRRRVLLAMIVLPLTFVPMAGSLGYFSGLLLAPLLSLMAAAAAADAVLDLDPARAAPEGAAPSAPGPAQLMWGLARDGLVELAWLLGISFGLLTLGMLWTTNCDPLGGAAYFVMGPLCSALLAWVAGLTTALLVGPRRRILVLGAAWLPFLASTIVGVHRLYFEPAVFAYDPFFGWFSGPIYDEGIAISTRYFRFRAYNFAAAGSAWLVLRASIGPAAAGSAKPYSLDLRRALASGPERVRLLVALVLAAIVAQIGLSAPRQGFTATRESLAETLGSVRETEHFIIHYGPTSMSAREIDMVAAEHEFAWHQLEQKVGRAPARKVESFVFASGELRGKLLGANRVEVSPPWRQQMYLSHRMWPHAVMHHELAHAFMGDIGDPLLGLPIAGGRFSGALVEGLPTALAPRPRDNLSIHEQAAILDRLGKRPSLEAIMGAGFWGAAANRAYTASGSFVLWLAQNHGWPAAIQLYANAGDFEASFGQDLATLEQAWLADLQALPLRERDIEAQAQRFMRGSVFRRPCAHRAAELATKANRARVRGQVDEALDAQQTLCSIEPEEPGHVLRLAEMLAGWDRFADAGGLLDELAGREGLTASIQARIAEQRGDTALLAGELDRARAYYESAFGLGLREAQRRQLEIKIAGCGDPELAPLIEAYFRPFTIDGATRPVAMLRLWAAAQIAGLPGHEALGNYLLARQFLIIAAPEQAAEVLDQVLTSEVGREQIQGWSPALVRAARLSRIAAKTQVYDWDAARAELEPLDQLAEGQGHRDVVEMWRARLEFFEAYFAAAKLPS